MGTMLSRVLGLVRDVVLANLLGAAPNADAFFVPSKFRTFCGAFLPKARSHRRLYRFSQRRGSGSHEAVRHLVDVWRVSWAAHCSYDSAGNGHGSVGGADLCSRFSRDAAKLALTADLIVWTFPYLLLISLTGFCGAILNSYGRFAVPAYTPVLLNLSLITAAVVWAPTMPEPALGLAMGNVGRGCAAAVPATLAACLKANTAACLGYKRRGRQKDTGTHGACALWRLRESD